MASGNVHFSFRVVGVDFGSGESETVYSGHFPDGTSINDLRGITGGLVLIPMLGKCEGTKRHDNRALVSPSVMMQADPSTWKHRRCDHCRSSVTMKPDYARLYGKQQ